MYKWLKLSITAFFLGIVVFVLGQFFFSVGFNKSVAELLKAFAIYQLYAFVLTFINTWFFDYLNKTYYREARLYKKLIIGFIGSLIITIVALIFLRFLVVVYFYGGNPETFLKNSQGYFLFGILMTIIISLAFHVIYFYKVISEEKVTESQVVAKTETAKYESLKSQLDPHFLFNSLNVLTSLIGENPALAEKFTTKLSKVYRYVLEQKNKDLITFDEELQFAKTYMELLKMRFEGAIDFEIPESASNAEFKIVPLSLQILLENAVKHNVISAEVPLTIKIFEETDYLVVQNVLNKKSVLGKSTKVGLKNIEERYGLISRRPVFIKEEDGVFTVKLPLLTQKIKKMSTNRLTEDKYMRARKKVDEIKGFYLSLIAYILVIPFLFFIWLKFTSHTIQWFWFPMFGWGIGLVFQGFSAFGTPIFGNNWEERKIKELMEKDKKEYWK